MGSRLRPGDRPMLRPWPTSGLGPRNRRQHPDKGPAPVIGLRHGHSSWPCAPPAVGCWASVSVVVL